MSFSWPELTFTDSDSEPMGQAIGDWVHQTLAGEKVSAAHQVSQPMGLLLVAMATGLRSEGSSQPRENVFSEY